MLNWLQRQKHADWIIRQLDLQPHQHLLETGCGAGRLLAAVAGQLHNHFLAANEPSLALYHQAVRRNENYISRDILQVHHGQLHDLPYPAGYFHSIYGCGSYYSWTNIFSECLRLSNLLRTGGKLILVSQPGRYRAEEELRTEAARLQAACQKAGLSDIHTEYRRFADGLCVAVKSTKISDYQSSVIINNRLLNPAASFMSKVARMQQVKD